MVIDVAGSELEALMWKPTNELRWFRPIGATDTEVILQALWERVTGERQWRDVPTVLAD